MQMRLYTHTHTNIVSCHGYETVGTGKWTDQTRTNKFHCRVGQVFRASGTKENPADDVTHTKENPADDVARGDMMEQSMIHKVCFYTNACLQT